MTELNRLFEIAPGLERLFAEARTRTGDEAYEGFKRRLDQTLERLGRKAHGLANTDREWILSSAPTGARQVAIRELTRRLNY